MAGHRRDADWYRGLRDRRREGQTWAALAREACVRPSTFAWWRCELRRRDERAAAARERGQRDEAAAGPRFLVVRTPASVGRPDGSFELRVGDATILVPADFDGPALERLLVAVRASC